MMGDQFYRNLMRLLHDTFPGYEFLVNAGYHKRELTRFANSEIHQNLSNESVSLTGIFVKDGKLVTVTSNDTSLDGLKRLRKEVDEMLENAPHLTFEFKMPPLRLEYPQEFADNAMLEVSPKVRAELFDEIKSVADSHSLKAFGYIANNLRELAVISTSGLYLYVNNSSADFNLVMLNDNMTGSYISGVGRTFNELNLVEKAKEIAKLAKMNVPEAEIEPGRYTAVLGPEAVATLFMYFAFGALNGFYHKLGTSSSIKYLGKRIAPDYLNFYDDPTDERQIPVPFDFVGTKREKFPIIENGEFKNVIYSYTAALMFGEKPTGHTFNLSQPDAAFPVNPVIKGGTDEKEELFSRVRSGVYIHRFHYVNIVDPSELVLTGMTRDGFFLIEDGKITKPLRNMRFNISFYELLKNLKGMSKETEAVESGFTGVVAPYILVEYFNFTSKTDH